MKKKIMSCVLSTAMLFSASASVLTSPAAAQSISSTQARSAGYALFPGDFVNFAKDAKILYRGMNGASLEADIDGTMLLLPDFSDVFDADDLPDGQKFYCWRVDEDTVPDSGKRTYIKLSAVFIGYDSEKADLSVSYSDAEVTLVPKDGYTLSSIADGFTYNNETNIVSGTAFSALSVDTLLELADTYNTEPTTVTIYDSDSQPVTELTVCPSDKLHTISFSAKAANSAGEVSDPISWSITGSPDNVSVNNSGTVTISPDFSEDSFDLTAVCGKAHSSVTVTLAHHFGEWTPATTAEYQGKEIRTCLCGAVEARNAQNTAATVGGTITMGEKSWSVLNTAPSFSEYTKKAELEITAADSDCIKETAYYISDSALSAEQLEELSLWTVGTTVTVETSRKFIVYARLTDTSGNISYICSDGIIVDTSAPVISGITDKSNYYESKSFTVTDENLDKVMINGEDAAAYGNVYTVGGDSTQTKYVVYAIDKAGNETVVTVSIYGSIVSADNTILGITEDATYRKGSVITFSAAGTESEAIRYIPTSYTINGTLASFSATYSLSATAKISTGSMSVGTYTISVIFTEQSYVSDSWQNTGRINTQNVSFKLENRVEIEKVRASLTASFYTVKFETNGGTKIDYVLVNRLKTLQEPIAPTRNGYEFDGWYTNSALTNKYDFSQRVSQNMTLYAKWKQVSNDNPFSDVSEDDWYYDNIAYVYATGLMNGTGDESFSPDMPTTRSMIVTILYRLEGQPSVSGNSFSDVASDAYYTNAVLWARKNNIVNGTSASTFSPDKEITREQLMTILYRYAEFKDYDISAAASLSSYSDYGQISSYANDAFSWAVASKIASGRTSSTLSPKSSATRAEVASAFKNFMDYTD